jgi:hypothetical protein
LVHGLFQSLRNMCPNKKRGFHFTLCGHFTLHFAELTRVSVTPVQITRVSVTSENTTPFLKRPPIVILEFPEKIWERGVVSEGGVYYLCMVWKGLNNLRSKISTSSLN